MGLFNTAIGGLQGALSGDWASMASGLLSGASQDYENLQAKLAAKRANQEQIAMWNMQNQYNSPVEQMARLKEAGLNPMLVYGGGNVSGNSTSSIGTAQVAANKANYQASVQGIQALADLKQTKANTENTQQNTTQSQANTLATYQDITNMQTANKIQQAQLQQERQNVQMGQMDLDIAKATQEQRKRNAITRAKADAGAVKHERFKESGTFFGNVAKFLGGSSSAVGDALDTAGRVTKHEPVHVYSPSYYNRR